MDLVRTFNKHVLNPVMMRLAGRRHWYAAVIRHTGRRSGKDYATPIVVERVEGGFLIPLPYGTGVDWLRNIRAAGTATIVDAGVTYASPTPSSSTRHRPGHSCPPGVVASTSASGSPISSS